MSKLWIMNDVTFTKLLEKINEDDLYEMRVTIKIENSLKDEEIIVINPFIANYDFTNYIR